MTVQIGLNRIAFCFGIASGLRRRADLTSLRQGYGGPPKRWHDENAREAGRSALLQDDFFTRSKVAVAI
jgi:hypothetical protein